MLWSVLGNPDTGGFLRMLFAIFVERVRNCGEKTIF